MPEQQSKTLEYRFFPLSPRVRFAVYAFCMLAGLFLQFIVYFPGHSAAGLILIGTGGLLMIGSTYSKVPKDLGFEEWKPVTEKEFTRVLRNYALVKQAKIPLILKKKEGMAVFIGIALVSFIFLGFFSIVSANAAFLVLALDISLFLYPLYLSGHVLAHAPKELELKMDRFAAVMGLQEKLREKQIRITPYLRFDKDSEGNHIPEDVRLMLEPKGRPDDLVGIQLQMTINNGPNGAVPYMYAVVICRGRGQSYQVLRNVSWRIPERPLTMEEGEEGDFTFLVIRQTTDNGGYHTTAGNCTALAEEIAGHVRGLR